jgi:ABC-type polysaccharide/polyol phosphate transport system ATPase subunit
VISNAHAVEVRALSKRFRRGERADSLRDLLPALAHRVRRAHAERPNGADEFWALKDVDFTVRPGEALGVIGPNGAGKSTLLKLLTRILRPTSGHCAVHGRVGALIEVAAGFHGDLTGRENVFLQGAVMGMRRREVARVFDDIVAFAGVGPFIDTPVKRYSSGMHARLGFPIAAHMEPQVLIVDEILAVGDLAFQERCVERMRDFKRRGTAIVFVSHNMQAVATLCERGLYLQSTVRSHGPARDVIRDYVVAGANQRVAPHGEILDIVETKVFDASGPLVGAIAPGAEFTVEVTCAAHRDVRDLDVGILLHRATDNMIVYHGGVDPARLGMTHVSAGQRFTFRFRFRANLVGGLYYFACQVYHSPTQEQLSRVSPAAMLTVDDRSGVTGIADLAMSCSLDWTS